MCRDRSPHGLREKGVLQPLHRGFLVAGEQEIALALGISPDTVTRRKQDDAEFAQALERGRAGGRQSLRRAQFRAAERGNATMLIWLGKQILGQKDKQEIEASSTHETRIIAAADYASTTEAELKAHAKMIAERASAVAGTGDEADEERRLSIIVPPEMADV